MDRRLTIRRLRREDAPQVQAFVRRLSPEARFRRFFAPVNELTERQLERVTTGSGPDDVSLAAFDDAGRSSAWRSTRSKTGRAPSSAWWWTTGSSAAASARA